MRRGSTPFVSAHVTGIDLTDKKVYATIAQGPNIITVEPTITVDEDDEDHQIATIHLTQEQTLSLHSGSARVQLAIIDSAGNAQRSSIVSIDVTDALLEEVIAYA